LLDPCVWRLGFLWTLTDSTGGERATTGLGGGDLRAEIWCADEIFDVSSLGGAGESISPSVLGILRPGEEGLRVTWTGISTDFFSLDDRLNKRGSLDGDLVGDLGGDLVDVGGDLGGDFGDSGGD
jgi:hypothetical protein